MPVTHGYRRDIPPRPVTEVQSSLHALHNPIASADSQYSNGSTCRSYLRVHLVRMWQLRSTSPTCF